MTVVGALAIVWGAGVLGICIMKKIQPENKIYPVWAAVVCVAFTLFLKWYVSQALYLQ